MKKMGCLHVRVLQSHAAGAELGGVRLKQTVMEALDCDGYWTQG